MTRNGNSRRGNGDSSLPVYPIRTVAKITGVSEGTLRAWEVRYGIITPARTQGGHRIFSENDIDRVIKIKRMLHKDGLSLAGVQRLLASSGEVQRG
jgi:MerR family transcriptional regulator, light-induced transcriptional regulator